MESVKICHFKTFRAGNFAFRTFCCFFLHYVHDKKFVCEDISAEYELESEKFKGGTHRLKEAVSYFTHMLLRITNLNALGQRFQV